MSVGLSEAELLERARAERAAIVSKYARGRTQGDNGAEEIAPPWEDPQYEDYHVTDKWGFIHDTRLPETHTKEEERSIEVEANRMLKWNKMKNSWDKYHGSEVKHRTGGSAGKSGLSHHQVSDKLYNRIYKGIPASFRGYVWAKLLGLATLKAQKSGKYDEMKELGCKWSPDVRQIDLDVNRTFRDNIMFRRRYDVKQQQLFYTLVAFSVYNQEVGYCQGMSQVAALLLMYMDEEDAFWALVALMTDSKYRMHGFFIPGFPKLLRFQEQHNKILAAKLPNLNKHLQRNCIDAGLYTLKWFFQCFLDRVPFPLCLRLWDVYMLEGERLLLAAGYTVLKLHRRAIQRRDMEKILDYIQKELVQDFGYPDDEVMQAVRKSLEELRRARLDSAGPTPQHELPSKPFGTFEVPSVAAEAGVRAEPGEEERHLTQQLIEQRLELGRAAGTGSHTSLDQSTDDVSSVGGSASAAGGGAASGGAVAAGGDAGFGSRASLANTSLTSAPDLSTLSSLTCAARQADADQLSLLSERLDALSGSGRSLVSPDLKGGPSPRSPPVVGRDGLSTGGVCSHLLRADDTLTGRKRHSQRATDGACSIESAGSQPQLAGSAQQGSHSSSREADATPHAPQTWHVRRSVLSDDGCYDVAVPYTRLPAASNGVEDSEEEDEDVNGSPVSSRAAVRPSKLSASQTTLTRDPDTLSTSEPATPRAGETPDAVRLYVPYAAGPGGEGACGPPETEDSGDTAAALHQQLTASQGKLALNSSTPGADPNKIKIHVDADDTVSNASSPRQADSSVGGALARQVHEFAFIDDSSPRSRDNSVDEEHARQERREAAAHSKPVSQKSSFNEKSQEKPRQRSPSDSPDSSRRGGRSQPPQPSGTDAGRSPLVSRTRTRGNIAEGDRPAGGGRSSSSSHTPSPRPNVSTPPSGMKSPDTSERSWGTGGGAGRSVPDPVFPAPPSNLSSPARATSWSSSSIEPVIVDPRTSPSRTSPSRTSSVVQVTVSSYYERRHHRQRGADAFAASPPGHEANGGGRVQHFYHHRQSSSPPVASPAMSPTMSGRITAAQDPRPPAAAHRSAEAKFPQRSLERSDGPASSTGGPERSMGRGRGVREEAVPAVEEAQPAERRWEVADRSMPAMSLHSTIVEHFLASQSHSSERQHKAVDVPCEPWASPRAAGRPPARPAQRSPHGPPPTTFKHFIDDEPLLDSSLAGGAPLYSPPDRFGRPAAPPPMLLSTRPHFQVPSSSCRDGCR